MDSEFLEREERKVGIGRCGQILFSLSQREGTSPPPLSLLDALSRFVGARGSVDPCELSSPSGTCLLDMQAFGGASLVGV